MTPHSRVKNLNQKTQRNGEFVLYWMQSSQRVQENWALTHAIETANSLDLPLVVYFGLTAEFPEANYRHYWFMLEGLREVHDELEELGIKFLVRATSPAEGVVALSERAACVVVDRGYLRLNREWYQYAAEHMGVPLIQVEDNVVVPVEEASDKEEYAAATIRPKLYRKIGDFLELPPQVKLKKSSLQLKLDSVSLDNPDKILEQLKINPTVNKSPIFRGGTSDAKQHLKDFLKNNVWTYTNRGTTPDNDCASQLSPYLHFGQISPIYIGKQTLEATKSTVRHRFLEELIVRRELAVNFIYYNKNYDSFACLPEWAKKTLEAHGADPRPYLYTRAQLETAQTDDPYWNAAQNEMVSAGKMNGYMRMYWGKKIIEWTKSPAEAFEVALYLNNRYELDGRDPNGYTGVAWCFGKHDHPWAERAVFGKVRYMNAAGLERKFKMVSYRARVNSLQ